MTSKNFISRVRITCETYIEKVAKFFEYLSGSIVLLVTLILLFSILNRYFTWGVTGIQGTAQILGVWLTFLMISQLEVNQRHIRVQYFYKKFSPRVRAVVDGILRVLTIIILGVLVVSSTLAVYEFRDSTPAALDFSSAYFYAALMFGITLLFLVHIFKVRADSRGDSA